MTDVPYEISQDLGDDPQESLIAMYQDKLPERHKIAEIDDEADRSIVTWMREEDKRDTDAHPDLLEEPRSYFQEQEQEDEEEEEDQG
ncbi:hypothetical protein [Nonomuraea typhae]|uniref:hypothetical protein n=1 Tax=Nonomuraea typhae TaxID=2603600 RepID=UPI0012F8A8B7|nr:hypothetical protein [Nonomuraea typhae]